MSRVRSVRAWGPSTGPTACALAGQGCWLWGWQKGVPGRVAVRRCEGRLESDAPPPPAARPLGGLPGLVGCVRCVWCLCGACRGAWCSSSLVPLVLPSPVSRCGVVLAVCLPCPLPRARPLLGCWLPPVSFVASLLFTLSSTLLPGMCGTAMQYAKAYQDAAVVGPLQLPMEASSGGGGQPGCLPTWRSGPPICSHRRLTLYQRQHSTPPPAWPQDLFDPPPTAPKAAGGGGCPDGREPPGLPLEPPPIPWTPRPPPGIQGAGAFVTVNSSDSSGSEEGGGGSAGSPLRSRGLPYPLEP